MCDKIKRLAAAIITPVENNHSAELEILLPIFETMHWVVKI